MADQLSPLVRPMVATAPHSRSRTLRLAALPTAPKLARDFVTSAVREWGLAESCADDAEVVTSELVTNAVKQTGRTDGLLDPGPTERVAVVSVWVHVVGSALRIEVWDNDRTPPEKREQHPDAENGRGLFLVEILSQQWGAYMPRVGGKVVWAEVGS